MSTNGSRTDSGSEVEILDANDVNRTVARIAHQIIENRAIGSSGADPVVILGIPSGGVPLAERIARNISQFSGVEVHSGALDITLYRDDLRKTPHRALQPTRIPESGIDHSTVILVDDVLFSGRTIRAALDAIRDLGRPNAIQLAVLVDRGNRRLPIKANYVGKSLPTNFRENVVVECQELDGRDRVLLVRVDN